MADNLGRREADSDNDISESPNPEDVPPWRPYQLSVPGIPGVSKTDVKDLEETYLELHLFIHASKPGAESVILDHILHHWDFMGLSGRDALPTTYVPRGRLQLPR